MGRELERTLTRPTSRNLGDQIRIQRLILLFPVLCTVLHKSAGLGGVLNDNGEYGCKCWSGPISVETTDFLKGKRSFDGPPDVF